MGINVSCIKEGLFECSVTLHDSSFRTVLGDLEGGVRASIYEAHLCQTMMTTWGVAIVLKVFKISGICFCDSTLMCRPQRKGCPTLEDLFAAQYRSFGHGSVRVYFGGRCYVHDPNRHLLN